MIESFLRDVLDVIEQQESRLLVWGLTDGRLSQHELNQIIDPILDSALDDGLTEYLDSNEVISALKTRGLLFDTDSFPYKGYRSRMAETVRLLFRLRQLFPKHRGPDDWQQARTLVSDYRFLWRRRRYPKREILIEDARNQFNKTVKSSITKAALDVLLSNRVSDFALAGFQERATTRILENLESKRTSGTLISAGTGSGKTLAFYLPAMSRVAELLSSESTNNNWVKILAIYPRTELLRDQFAEIYTEARKLDTFLKTNSKRKIRIGALFGATPPNINSLKKYNYDGWRRTEEGFICGFLICTVSNCGGELIWLNSDLNQNRETLTCNLCGHTIKEDEVALTRVGMERHPPDVLFTTTEMLNQRLSDSTTRHLFGLRPGVIRPPEMVLLDEVHTYAGAHGAQVGYLLRRWRHLVRAPISFVGLSATLRDGSRFFTSLIGLREDQVVEIAPRQSEMKIEGAEYLLALRGDPVSRASLLSTTIQATMLISRMLDTSDGVPSAGTFGQKVFAFTDDIDVINRLYFSLLDAEGRKGNGDPNLAFHPDGGLAILRRPMPSESRERYGQNWQSPILLGHKLNDRKRIGRTSSQDPGVSANMDVIVATASLEVGFNDPTVGAVIQHKGPRDPAQFLQRKGRAGRPRKMRPWTMVILSDYGRDRLAYRNYEQLFDPELDVRYLPFSSRYIQRMQSVYTLIDYLCMKLINRAPNGSVWKDLSGPNSNYYRINEQRKTELVSVLEKLLDNPDFTDEFQEYLEQALGISRSDSLPLLWEFPRPILTSVIPTALRRILTNWQVGNQSKADFKIQNSPLPEFAPNTLFSDLNLPEVQIVIPPAWHGDNPKTQNMPIVQALRDFAPGRVSRRFGVKSGHVRHWVVGDTINAGEQEIKIQDLYKTLELGSWDIQCGNEIKSVSVFRPVEIMPIFPPSEVNDTSNAQLEWHTQILTMRRGTTLIPPLSSVWHGMLELECYSHFSHTPIKIRRFTTGALADIKFRGGDSNRTRFNYTEDGETVALGFSMDVDALRFRIPNPPVLWSKINLNDSASRALRTKRFFDTAWSGDGLELVDNPFARQWLSLIYFTALTHDAFTRRVSLYDADEALAIGTASIAINEVLDTIFQSSSIPNDEDDTNVGDNQDRLRQELDGLLGRPDVINELRHLALFLWEPIDATWETWLQKRYTTTIAAAANECIQNLCPEIDSEGLVVDIETGPKVDGDVLANDKNCTDFWISEKTPGGSGLIEAFLRTYTEDPGRFYLLLTTALAPTEYEIIDYQLGKLLGVLSGAESNIDLVNAVKDFRGSESIMQVESTLEKLRNALSDNNYVLFHGFLSALSNRVLRPGATINSDEFLFRAWSTWIEEEKRIGVEIDSRTIAYGLSQDNGIDSVMVAAGLTVPQDELMTWRYNTISGLLWGRGADTRRVGLELYNPFTSLPDAERLLVISHLDQRNVKLSLEDDNWKKSSLDLLGEKGNITLYCQCNNSSRLATMLRFFATNPVESDYLSVFARTDAVRRVDDMLEIDLTISEVSQ